MSATFTGQNAATYNAVERTKTEAANLSDNAMERHAWDMICLLYRYRNSPNAYRNVSLLQDVNALLAKIEAESK